MFAVWHYSGILTVFLYKYRKNIRSSITLQTRNDGWGKLAIEMMGKPENGKTFEILFLVLEDIINMTL